MGLCFEIVALDFELWISLLKARLRGYWGATIRDLVSFIWREYVENSSWVGKPGIRIVHTLEYLRPGANAVNYQRNWPDLVIRELTAC
jgi:hypothetical protein